ncbi:unnamed protein product [Miscanthus lutarioriparius]|uniref:DUF4220 domain-containing protein n=1 Tax=Miscanthus lutarioriparius TaxID=422564 RepID=A0A811R0H2_9POAL|nr:unnamed protein product [Miscanthus lutarioriparius]
MKKMVSDGYPLCDIDNSATPRLPFVYNLTIFYSEADLRGDEALMVATSILMFALAVLFFILNLFSRFSDGSANLNPSIRIFLSSMLSLFLPATSYLFSEAKNQSKAGHLEDLSIRARTILMWMLLVELLRKKVESILLTAGIQVYSHTVERGARVVWLGSLIFFNLKSTGKKALYGILWVLAAAKLVQRFAIIELAKRSFAYRKNPRLLSAYMAEMLKLPADHHRHLHQKAADEQCSPRSDDGGGQPRWSDALRSCNYAVMGEEDLKREPGPHGYKLVLVKPTPTEGVAAADSDDDSTSYSYIEDVVTVGRIWRLADTNLLLRRDPRLKRLCLSFALYKLLRRRLEDLPITHLEASNCHDLIFNGLLVEKGGRRGERDAAVAVIQVFSDEIQFLCEYYHSIHPVVVASPFFFVHNYILFPIIVLALCLLMLTLCSNGDVHYAFHSFTNDNYVMSTGILKMAGCILRRASRSAPYLFCSIDISITFLLLLTLAYEEVWEVIVFLLSNWFMVSLLCSHTSSATWRTHRVLRRVIPAIVAARNTMMNQHNVRIKQLSVLWFSRPPLPWLPLPLSTTGMAVVPMEAKKLIVERLARASYHAHPLSNGMPVVLSGEHRELSWACDSSGGVAEVILVWHIATSLLEARCPGQKGTQPEPGRAAATALSRYCAYLVAFHPKLLPDDKDGTKFLYAGVKRDLRKLMGWCAYYCSREVDVSNKLLDIAVQQQPQQGTSKVICKGARLGKALIDKYKDGARESVWKLLGDLWTEVATYAAPASGEMHVKAHKEALVGGGEFITVLWAIATHTGITRQEDSVEPPPPSASVSCRV